MPACLPPAGGRAATLRWFSQLAFYLHDLEIESLAVIAGPETTVSAITNLAPVEPTEKVRAGYDRLLSRTTVVDPSHGAAHLAQSDFVIRWASVAGDDEIAEGSAERDETIVVVNLTNEAEHDHERLLRLRALLHGQTDRANAQSERKLRAFAGDLNASGAAYVLLGGTPEMTTMRSSVVIADADDIDLDALLPHDGPMVLYISSPEQSPPSPIVTHRGRC